MTRGGYMRRRRSRYVKPPKTVEDQMATPPIIDNIARIYRSVREWSNTFRFDEGPPGLPRRAVAEVFAQRVLLKEVSANLSILHEDEDLVHFVEETAEYVQEFAFTLDDDDDVLTARDTARILKEKARELAKKVEHPRE